MLDFLPAAVRGVIASLLLALNTILLCSFLFIVALFKALPFAKVLLTGGSMAASVWLYAQGRGVEFAICFVLMIFVHEMGHGLAMKRAGIEAGWPVFIPFFGAMIAMKGQPKHPRIEADIAYAGPVAGTGAALFCAALGLWLHSHFFLTLAYLGFYLNLFNMTPIGFLDGGRIARILSKKASIIGAVVMGALCFMHPSPQLILIAGMAVLHAFQRNNDDLGQVTAEDRKTWALRYFGLCAFLGVALLFTAQLASRMS